MLARLTFVRACIASSDPERALATARELALANPHLSEVATVLGEALAASQLLPAAIAEFQRALRLNPDAEAARLDLARTWLDAGEPDKADEVLSWIGHNPDAAGLRERGLHMRTQPRSDAGYVRHLFDQFSADYDVRMRGQLAYAAPEILHGLAQLTLARKRDLHILDLGCGTGLAGVAFRGMASSLDGIDLSPAMIERARARQIYDRLVVGDIETAHGSHGYDLVLAADTLVYVGDLDRTLDAVCTCLGRDGFFLFTVEKKSGEGFDRGPKRRWRHSETYLRDRASAHGLTIAGLVACTPRTEAGQPVEGLACAMERTEA